MKCDIEKNELVEDAYSLLDRMDKLTDDEDNHFTVQDIEDALMGYKLWYCTFPRNSIKYLTGLEMKENKRNKRLQTTHLKLARSNRDILCLDKGKVNWWEGGGRPEGSVATVDNSRIASLVKKWIDNHPDCHNKSACARDLGLTRPTVRKWWNIINSESLDDKIRKVMDAMKPVEVHYQMELTSDEMMSAMTNPDDPNYDKIWKEIID